MYINVFNY